MENKRKIWDNCIEVGSVQKSDAIKITVSAAIRDGVKYINLREFYKRKKDDVWMPGRDGITIPLLRPIKDGAEMIKPYEGLIRAMSRAADTLEDMELIDEENAVYAVEREK